MLYPAVYAKSFGPTPDKMSGELVAHTGHFHFTPDINHNYVKLVKPFYFATLFKETSKTSSKGYTGHYVRGLSYPTPDIWAAPRTCPDVRGDLAYTVGVRL